MRKLTRTSLVACLVLGVGVLGRADEEGVPAATGLGGGGDVPVSSAEFRQMQEDIAILKGLKLDDPSTLRAYYNNGLNFATADGLFKLKIGGRIHLDYTFINGESDLENAVNNGNSLENGAEFRRARIYLSGKVWHHFEYKVQYDFVGGDADFRDVYLGIVDLPVVGNVRVGHFKEPFGLEELTSSNYITFLERALPAVFAPVRNVGAMIHNSYGEVMPMSYALGVFLDDGGDNFGTSVGDDNIAGTARVTLAPIYADDGRMLVHFGGAYSIRNPLNDMVRFRQRPEVHLAPRYVDTRTFSADMDHRFGGEAAAVFGPFSLQGELMGAYTDGERGTDDEFLWGLYVMASFFLTGEHRPYDTNSGIFGRVKPNSNFLVDGGIGAWELAARYSRLDFDEGNLQGGVLNNFTGGINWYWNPVFRMMVDYVYSNLESTGESHAVLIRWSVAF